MWNERAVKAMRSKMQPYFATARYLLHLLHGLDWLVMTNDGLAETNRLRPFQRRGLCDRWIYPGLLLAAGSSNRPSSLASRAD